MGIMLGERLVKFDLCMREIEVVENTSHTGITIIFWWPDGQCV